MMPALPQTSTAPTPSLLAMLTPVQGGDAGEAGAFDQLVAQAKAAVPTAPVVDVVRLPAPAAVATIASVEAAPIEAPVAGEMQAVQAPSTESISPPIPVRAELVEAPSFSSTPQEENTALRQAQGERRLGMQRFVDGAMPTAPEVGMDVESKAVETATPGEPEAAPTDKAILAANELLATLAQFTVPAGKPAAAKPAIALPAAEGESASEGETPVATEAAPIAALLASTAAPAETRPAGKPAAEMAPTAKPHRDDTPALPTAAPKVRADAPALPMLAALEPAAAKPVAEPSMAVLFAQPATAAATALAGAAPVATIAERVLDLTSDDAWIEQLAADIAATKSASGDISFRLMPRHLGRLDVSMMAGDEGVSVRLDTQHEATAAIVAAAQPRLADDLRQQGVRVADTQVTHTPPDTGRPFQQGQGQNRGAAQDAAHLIETATERDTRETRDERSGERRGRFA